MTDISKLQRKIDEINAKCGFSEPEFIKNLQTFPETMENKDIDKAAREYALKRYPEECGDDPYEAGLRTGYRNGYVDSHISRQSEIDELVEALEEATRWVTDRNPNNGDRVVVKFKLACGKMKYGIGHYFNYNVDKTAFGKAFTDAFGWTVEGSTSREIIGWRPIDTPKATQLLEKYGKK